MSRDRKSGKVVFVRRTTNATLTITHAQAVEILVKRARELAGWGPDVDVRVICEGDQEYEFSAQVAETTEEKEL